MSMSLQSILKLRQQKAKAISAEEVRKTLGLDSNSSMSTPSLPVNAPMSVREGTQVLEKIMAILPLPLLGCLLSFMKTHDVVEYPEVVKVLEGLHKPLDIITSSIALIAARVFGIVTPTFTSDRSALDYDPEVEKTIGHAPELKDLLCYGLPMTPMKENGVLKCFCGETPDYKPPRSWGRGVTPGSYFCRGKVCRFQVQTNALGPLEDYLKSFSLDRIPLLVCPDHRDKQIVIAQNVDKSGVSHLRVRCASLPDDGKRWCECAANIDDASYSGPLCPWALELLSILQ